VDENGTAVAQVSGAAQPLPPPASSVSDYVFEPDPSVLAAGLTGQLAQTHALLPLEHGIPYLTGANLIDDRALGVFRVVAVLPADEKRLGAELRSRGIGRLEIKCRGVPIAPAELRRRLRLQGDRSSVLLVTPQNGQTIAVLAEREGLTPHGSFG
jgi:hypothetical protein